MKALRNIIRIAAAVVGFFGLITLLLILAGYRPYILKTASMEPLYAKGSLCWVDTKVKLDSVSVGDVLVYRSSTNMLVLHRLVDILPIQAANGSLSVTMQGDANSTQQDILLSNINFIGREAFTIPRLGEMAERILTGSGSTWFFVVFFLFLACIYPWKDEVGLVHNDNGIAECLQPNRVVGRNVIFGPFFLAGLSEEDFTDLSDDLISKYSELFSAPEVFLPCADGHLSAFHLITLPDSTQVWKEIR